MDADPSPIFQKISVSKDAFRSALTSPEFYIELMCVGLSLALAGLVAFLIRKRVDEYLKKHPPGKIEATLITKPLLLLAPLFAIFALSLCMPIAIQFTGGTLVDSAMKLTIAYLAAKGVIVVVKSRPVAWFIACVIMLLGALRATGFLGDTIRYLKSVEFDFGKVHLNLLNIAHGLVSLVVVFWLAGAFTRTLEGYLRNNSRLNYSTRELLVKFFKIFVYIVALMVTLQAMGVDLTAFAVFGGALGVGIGLGLQKITANFVSGITLLVEKSIKIGDLIEVGGQTGWVRQLNIRYLLLETADGREMLIPNDDLISTRVTNWTHSNDLARLEVKVGIAYEADVALAQKLMIEAVQENRKCLKKPEPTSQLREFGDSSLNFILTFWIPDVHEGRYGIQSDVMLAVLEKFRKNGIDIPYPHQVSLTKEQTPSGKKLPAAADAK